MYNEYEYDVIGKCNRYVYRTASMKNVFKISNPGKEYLE